MIVTACASVGTDTLLISFTRNNFIQNWHNVIQSRGQLMAAIQSRRCNAHTNRSFSTTVDNGMNNSAMDNVSQRLNVTACCDISSLTASCYRQLHVLRCVRSREYCRNERTPAASLVIYIDWLIPPIVSVHVLAWCRSAECVCSNVRLRSTSYTKIIVKPRENIIGQCACRCLNLMLFRIVTWIATPIQACRIAWNPCWMFD